MKKFLIVLLFLFGCKDDGRNSIDKISSSFKEIEYSLNPLGENFGIDNDPLYRFDKFDCLTYVETVLALHFAKNKDEFETIINNIRYSNGKVSFETRNHFTNPDWIRNNRKYVSDITNNIATKLNIVPSISFITLDRSNWFKKNYNLKVDYDLENVSLNYIDIDTLLLKKDELLSIIKKPMVINIVINNPKLIKKIGTQLDTSHIGFILPNNNELIIRHASSFQKKVVDNNFFEYLKRLKKYPQYVGVNFLEIKS